MTDFKKLKGMFDKDTEGERYRLDRDYYSMIEFEIQTYFMDTYIKKGSSVLDIGSGPGKYAIHMISKGMKVGLVDLSSLYLNQAVASLKEQNMMDSVILIRQGNATSLVGIKPASFDHALLMGPWVYMEKESERKKSLLSAKKVIKKGGTIFLTVLNNNRFLQEIFHAPSVDFRLMALKKYKKDADKILKSGINKIETSRKIIKDCGLKIVETYGTDSVAGPAFNKIDEMVAKDKKSWDAMIDILKKTAHDPVNLGLSTHITFVLKK